MKYFWQLFTLIMGITLLTFLFFALSVRVKNSVSFTGEDAVTAPEITSADPQLGPKDAPVTIVEFGDYSCAACASLAVSLKEIRAAYGDDVRIVWKDMPNASAHPEAIPAAVAAHCGGKQGAFWEYHDILMANQPLLSTDFYLSVADTLNLRANAFSQCVTREDTLPLVERGYAEGSALHVTAIPTVFLNGERYTGLLSTNELSRAIDALLLDL